MAFLNVIRRFRACVGSRRWRLWLVALALLGAVPSSVSGQAATSDEYRVKAAFLFNFAQFVEWPARAFRDEKSPLVIGVLGADPFGSYLDDLVTSEKIGGRPLTVRRYQRLEDIGECHLLFFGKLEAAALEKAIAGLKGRSILSVGDADTFTRAGGMVRFVTEEGKIRLRINVAAAKAGELKISSKILRPATIVTPGKD